jgi:beta-glucosidase
MYAIDGMATTRYSSGMPMAAGDYFQVDLGSTKMISGIIVDTSSDPTDVANGYDVTLSTDGTTFGNPVATCMYNAAPMEVINFTATMARYVRYTNKGAPGLANGPTSWLSIHEFSVICN